VTTLDDRTAVRRPRTHRHPVRARPGHVLAPIAGGAAAVIALWWHDTPAITGFGDWLTNAGRVTGLLAGFAAAVLMILMARIPALDRGVGTDRLARWHAMGGRYMFGLVIAHPLLIIWGYAVTAHTGVVGQTKTLLLSYPDVLMATVAGLLFVGIGIVSIRAARRRMRYETWYYLHFYTYLAIALAFSHQFATGADFMTNRPARVLWAALYVIAGGLLVVYRFALPLRRAFRHRMRVHSVRKEAPGTVSVWIHGRHLEEMRAEPGQFFRWRFLTRDLWWAANPYSLSAPARPDFLRITVKTFGEHSGALARLRPGTRVFAEGPYGAFTAGRRRHRKVLLLAGGVGITPIRTLFETIPAGPGDLTLIYRATDWTGVVFRDELHRIAEARDATVHYLVGSRRELGGDPLSPTALTRILPDLRSHDVYVCGPDGMAAAATRAVREAGVPRGRIHHESFEF
jgi:predicted ferric reductase